MSRIGLVLGAGGATGHAFHAGVLAGIEDALGWDPRDAEILVGTSAGSIVAALLRAGFSASDIAARATGRPLSAEGARLLASMGFRAPEAVDPPGGFRFLQWPSPRLLMGAMLRPWDVRLGSVIAALSPEGRVPTDEVVAGFHHLFGDRWPKRALWINAVRLDQGRRVVFGRDPVVATVAEAVSASCAIPAYYRPARIGGVRYVDGGAHSPTNADLAAGLSLDLVIVSSPMSYMPGAARIAIDAGARAYSRMLLMLEVARVRASGTRALLFEPDRSDLAVMGLNAMDPRKRAVVAEHVRAAVRKRVQRSEYAQLLAG